MFCHHHHHTVIIIITITITIMIMFTTLQLQTEYVALLRLVRGNDFWKSVHAPSKWCFGRRVFDHGSFYLRSCRFGMYLLCLCQFHWGIGLCWVLPFWTLEMCFFLKWCGGLVVRDCFFIFRISPGIARVSPKTRYLSCLVLLLLLLPLLLLL